MQRVVTLYFKKDFSLIASVRTINKVNNLPTQLDPVHIFQGDLSNQDYKAIILEGLERAEKNPYIERTHEYPFWQVDGIQSYNTFNKQFSCVKIRENKGKCLIQRLKRVTGGGYGLDKGHDFEFYLSDLEANIPHIRDLLSDGDTKDIEDPSFKTLENNLVSYQELPDGYDDLGDGHTDAYQMYADAANNRNLLAFMIDSGYESFGETDIKEAFERFWGPLDSYDYTLSDDNPLYAKVHALSRQYEIQSYLFKDGETYLEVQYQIDLLQTSEERRQAIQGDFERLIQSIAIKEIE